MRILVIQTAFIGDVVLTTPFLLALRERFPEAELHVVATPQGCEVLAGIEGVRCHVLDKRGTGAVRGLRKTITSLGRDKNFEYVFCVHRSLRSLALAKNVRARRKIAFRSFWSKLFRFETVAYPPYDEKIHYADKPLALLSVLGVAAGPTPRPRLCCVEADLRSAREKLGSITGQAYLVISPFSVWGTKVWFADRFARVGVEVARRLGLPVVLIGSGSVRERTIAETICEKLVSGKAPVVNLVGQTTLGELKAVIKGATALVANDSAPVHIAAAFDVSTVAIFGPTARRWGFFPLSTHSVVVERHDVSCRPCHLHGPEKCPRGHFRCMNEIQVEDVVQAVQNLLR